MGLAPRQRRGSLLGFDAGMLKPLAAQRNRERDHNERADSDQAPDLDRTDAAVAPEASGGPGHRGKSSRAQPRKRDRHYDPRHAQADGRTPAKPHAKDEAHSPAGPEEKQSNAEGTPSENGAARRKESRG